MWIKALGSSERYINTDLIKSFYIDAGRIMVQPDNGTVYTLVSCKDTRTAERVLKGLVTQISNGGKQIIDLAALMKR